MGYLTKMNGEFGQNSFSAVGFSILGQPPRSLEYHLKIISIASSFGLASHISLPLLLLLVFLQAPCFFACPCMNVRLHGEFKVFNKVGVIFPLALS